MFRFSRCVMSLLIAPAILTAPFLFTGCSPSESASTKSVEAKQAEAQPSTSEVDFVVEDLSLDLATLLPAADAQPLRQEMKFTSAAEAKLLSAGWEPFAPGSGKGIWMGSEGVVEVILPKVEPLNILMPLMPSKASKDFPGQFVYVFWNGYEIGKFDVPNKGAKVSFDVPVKAQKIGANRMQLIPGYSFQMAMYTPDLKNRTISLRCDGIEFRRKRPQIPQNRQAATGDGNDVILAADSTLLFDLKLPENAALSLKGKLENADSLTGTAEAIVAITDESGEQTVLLDQKLSATAGEFALEQELKEFSGQFASLSLSFPFTPSTDDKISTSTLPSIRFASPQIKGSVKKQPEIDLSEKKGGYNVLCIVFDTLRADFIEPYGDTTTKTPVLQELAQSGVVFEQASSMVSWTRPSVASYLTGLRANSHQVHTKEMILPQNVLFLPETMKKLGYKTMSFILNANVSAPFGFGRGVDKMVEAFRDIPPVLPDPKTRAEQIWKQHMQPFIEKDPGKPFFMYVHEIDPHAPNAPRSPYYEMYPQGGNWRRLDQSEKTALLVDKGAMTLTPEQVDGLRSVYRGEISYMDAYLGELLKKFREAGALEDTLVIFMSDHGEEFYEHGRLRHAKALYEETLHVPLMFALDGVLPSQKRVKTPVELIDVFPTILDFIDEDIPPSLQGRSLLPELFGSEPATPRPVYTTLGPDVLDGIKFGRYKMIRRIGPGGALQKCELYDLETDPGEKNNVWAQQLVVGRALRQMLDLRTIEDKKAQTDKPVEINPKQMDPQVRKDLQNLGYL